MKNEQIEIKITGIKPIILNGYVSKDDVNIPVEKKLNFDNGNIVITSERIMSFLIDNNPKLPSGCIKLFTEKKKYKDLIPKAKAYVAISPRIIPIAKKGDFVSREDKVGGGGVPNMIKRPMIENWEANFNITLWENPDITFNKLKDWFDRGGIEVGLGAWRPFYGQFIVSKFEKKQ